MQENKLVFCKMHGCGNDYIYFDCFSQTIEDPARLSCRLSNRRFGIGGDGIVLVCPSECADVKMRMFNADGSEGKMCGNAARCVAKLVYEKGIVKKNKILLETKSGIKTLWLDVEEGIVKSVRVDMGAPILACTNIPVLLEQKTAIGIIHKLAGKKQEFSCVSMGNPHCVIFTDEIKTLDLEKIGPKYEDDPLFPERVNTEFVTIVNDHTLEMRVWERGSGETLACGTGACAVVVAAVLGGVCPQNEDITVKLRGGDLVINYTGETVFMTGPACIVFEGEVAI